MKNPADFQPKNRSLNGEKRADAALAWLSRSIQVCSGAGSAHSFSPVFGWRGAYPETTGYLIETLLRYADLKNRPDLRDTAIGCADWLCRVQLPTGAFASGVVGGRRPSIFNTGQILFGLAACGIAKTGDAPTQKICLEKSVRWLLDSLEPDGSWQQAAFVPGYVPSYYTRAIWGVLRADDVLQHPDIQPAMCRALHFYAQRFTPQNTVRDWGFRPGEAAFTHTIAYTLEGFVECAVRLGERDVLAKTAACMDVLLAVRHRDGRTAGRYDERWRGDYSFICLTGNAQLSIVCRRLFRLTGEPKYARAADEFLAEIIDFQKVSPNPNLHGALPGSAPFSGKYMRWRYPNWAAKFFLDALFEMLD